MKMRVMLSTYLVLISCLLCIASASVCVQGKQYLNTELEACVNCTECLGADVILLPCEIYRDTICGTIGELFRIMQTNGAVHRQRHHHRQRHRHEDDAVWTDVTDVTSTEIPFNSAETLVWDWQAIALTSAVFVCILFFLVITLYSLHQAKQWRRLKDNFEADVEELSAKLSLMAATSNEKGEMMEPCLGPIGEGNYLNNRCVYLEQLLNVRKDTKIGPENVGNVYIQETNGTPKT